jgi:hypothetical protein
VKKLYNVQAGFHESISAMATKQNFVARKWLSSRTIRQETCIELLKAGSKHLDEYFFDDLNKSRMGYDKQLWKILITQLTITGFLMLSLLDLNSIHFSIFGFSADALKSAREFLLLCHALCIGFATVLQQHIQKLEDFLVGFARQTVGGDQADNDELKIYVTKFLNPVETFNIIFLPYRKHLFYNMASKFLVRLYAVARFVVFIGFVAFTLIIPIIATITIAKAPNFGWFSYCIVGYWWAMRIFSLAATLLNIFPLPYADYSYAMKLSELQKKDPVRHQQIHAEIAKTGKLPEI